MSKVLVDRELLRDCSAELSGWRMSLPNADSGMTDRVIGEIDAILAQPAEAEGVAVVGVVCVSRFKNNPAVENVEFHLAADLPQGQNEVVLHSAHLAALSAVTAERDRLRAEVERYVPLHEAVQRAAGELPEGWAIQLHIERDGGGVELIGPDGTVDFATNNERLDYTVIDALEAAMAAKEA